MRPPENHDTFDHHNVRIHGIRPEQVAGLPRFGELFPEIGAFIGGDVLAAHNAAFDLGVIRSGLEVSGAAGPRLRLRLHRDVVPALLFPGVQFAALRRRGSRRPAGQPPRRRRGRQGLRRHPDRHRRAQPGRQHRRSSTCRWGWPCPSSRRSTRPATRFPRPPSRRWAPPAATAPPRPGRSGAGWPEEGANPVPNPDAEPGNPLFGQTVVFTGELAIPRPEAKVRSAELGARPESRVTARTTRPGGGGRLRGRGPALRPADRQGQARPGTARPRPAHRGAVRGGIPADGGGGAPVHVAQ